MATLTRKAFAYITHGDRLLVFSHPQAPEARIQLPAGTVREGESLTDAVLRAPRDATGLDGLVLLVLLSSSSGHACRTTFLT